METFKFIRGNITGRAHYFLAIGILVFSLLVFNAKIVLANDGEFIWDSGGGVIDYGSTGDGGVSWDQSIGSSSTPDIIDYGSRGDGSVTWEQGAPQPTPTPQPPVCTPSWRDLYPECKPGTNLACKVQQDTCSGEYRYVDCWQQPGVCGNPPASQPQQPTQPAVCTLQNETYPECGSWCGTQGRQPADVLSIVTRTVIDRNACSAVYSCDIRGRVPGQCGVPVQPSQPQTVGTCKGTLTVGDLNNQLRGAGYGGPWDPGSSVAAFNRAACPTSVQQSISQPVPVVQQPVVQPTPTTPPVAVQVPASLQNQAATLNCPAGQLPQVINSTVVCVQVQQQQNQTQTVLAYGGNANATGGSVNLTVPQPQVITAGYTTYAAELPKTGLPLGVWAFGALTPIGMVIRKLSSGLKNSLNKPVSIWQMREFLRGS